MKKTLAIILSIIMLFTVGINVYAISDDYSSMGYADSVSLGSSKSHHFTGGGSDYQAWFKFRPTETNYYKFSASSSAYLSVKLYNSSHSFIDSDYGNYVEVGTMMYAYNEYYLWVDSGERYNGHYVYVSVQSENHDISSSNFSVTFDDGNKYYYQDGNPIYPNVTVYGNGSTLRLNRDFTVTYKNNKNVGTGTATIEGVGDYTGTVNKTFSIVSHTHSWGAGTVTIAATCKNTGTKKYTCSVCGATKTETIPKTSTHNYIEEVSSSNLKTEATCQSAAIYYKSCSVCGVKNYNSTFTSGSVDATKHIYDNTCDASCNICGATRTVSHSYKTEWVSDGTQHWKECSGCGDKLNVSVCSGGIATCITKAICTTCNNAYGSIADHSYKEVVDAKYLKSAATCVSAAEYYKSCEICEIASATEIFTNGSVDAKNHVGGTYLVNSKEADCQNKGYTGDQMCNNCHAFVSAGTLTEFGSHVPESVWSTDPTHHWKACLTVGCGNLIDKAEHSGGTATCKVKAICATCQVEYGTIKADNHVGETEIKGAEPATCDKDGYTGDTWCKDCNTKIKDGEPIPAGHKTTEVPANPATHEAAGNIKYYTCSGCSLLFADAEAKTEIKAEDTVVAKGEHSYGEWVNTDAENHWKECACGNKIETAAHTYGDWTVTKESTTTEKGSKEKTCSVCGHKVTEELPLAEATDKEPSSPQTGDNSNLLLWFALLMVSALGLVSTVVFKKKRAR